MLTVVGFPRSGTNFLHRMLAHYIDGPKMPVWNGMGQHDEVQKIHWAYQREEFGNPNVYIYRDPRDCALSGWAYVQRLKNTEIPLMEFLEHHFSGQWILWPVGWKEHTRYWRAQGIPSLRYEDLCESRRFMLLRLILALNLELDESRLVYAMEKSFAIGTRNDGRWEKELPKEAAEWIDAYCGNLMKELGYR